MGQVKNSAADSGDELAHYMVLLLLQGRRRACWSLVSMSRQTQVVVMPG
jgi:hypothetical protein